MYILLPNMVKDQYLVEPILIRSRTPPYSPLRGFGYLVQNILGQKDL